MMIYGGNKSVAPIKTEIGKDPVASFVSNCGRLLCKTLLSCNKRFGQGPEYKKLPLHSEAKRNQNKKKTKQNKKNTHTNESEKKNKKPGFAVLFNV